ncbi:type II secretion system secretin GspD [Ruegeria marina]|uniref:General secretion pathway protein D n=1 Tax=Ruegeria marina TaxID=639004 RepID=A0A1G7CD01_9RHOB|nr:type II secretion system secretin GspD [Ruegeria marina]SDE37207.1 general secretion pathway protein D [Ruegeria marina]
MKFFGKLRAFAVASLVFANLCCAPSAQAQVNLDLRDADLRSFVSIVADATGRGFVLDPNVRGTVTVLAPDGLPPDALYEVFLNVLELNRLTIVEGRDADRIVPISSARELSTGSEVVLDGGYETRVIEVVNVPLQEVVEVVRPLLPAEAVLTAVPRSRMLILSDRGDNFAKIEKLIRRLDEPRQQPVTLVQVHNANAGDLLQVVQSLNIVPPEASVTVDLRSNALIVAGPISLADQIRVLANRLDTQDAGIASAVEKLRYADATALADVVLRSFTGQQQVSGESAAISIVPDLATNSLLITAPADRIQNIIAMIRYLDQRPEQVLVEAVIFEMSVEGFSDLSVQFGAVLNDALVGGVQFDLQNRPTLTSLITAAVNGNPISPGNGGILGGGRQTDDDAFFGFISAVATTNSTRLMATPSVMTLNNKEAEIVVAQNVPFVTGSFTTVGTTNNPENPFQTIERQNVGLTLKVTPQVNGEDTVRLVIEQEVSRLTNSTAASGGEITANRSLTTTVLVRDSNVVMLGGLLEDASTSQSQRVPTISEIPVLGSLFRGKNAAKDQRILLIMLRPRVISSDAEARRLADKAAKDARRATLAMATRDGEQLPKTPSGIFPYDGSDLNQPFDAGFVDDVAQSRNFPLLPPRIQF